MKKILIILAAFCQACSYTNVSMAHTQGTATDVIDDTVTSTPTISPDITVPISPTGL